MKNLLFFISTLGLVVWLVLAQACKSPSTVRPPERYIHMPSSAPSTLHIPIVIERNALVGLVNAQMPKVLVSEENFQGYGVALTVSRSGDFSMAFRQNPENDAKPGVLFYDVPLEINVSKQAFITTLKAEGVLNLRFATTLEVASNWEVKTSTVLDGYEWKQTPELSFGPLRIPIDGLTSKLIARMESNITSEIDAGISENVDLKSSLTPLYQDLCLPKILSEEYNGYLLANPIAIGLGELKEKNGGMSTTLELALKPKVGLGRPPVVYPSSLPQNSGVAEPTDAFELSIQSLLGYEDMKSVLAKAIVDTTLSQAGRNATIKDVELYGQDDRLVIGLRMVGDYEGWAYLKAQPVFDADSERLELQNMDIILDTKNILYKSIGYLFRTRIKKEINAQMGEQIASQLDGIRKEINDQLSGTEVTPGVRIDGSAHKVSIIESLVTSAGLSAEIRFGGSLAVRVSKVPVD